MRTTRLASVGVLLGAVASTPGATAPTRATTGQPVLRTAIVRALRVSPESPELVARPALVDRLRKSPHDYFRFVNRPFADAVCALFDDVRDSLPDVNLHGDAHVEQYAVTSIGRGLTDFDDSARGPYVVDLVRFGVSLELASRQNGWGNAGGAVDAFLDGYRDALAEPSRERPPRDTVRRARSGFASDHGLALRRAESLIDADPLPPAELEGDFRSYVAATRARAPGLPATFFRIKKAGRLALGIGSALDEKFLLRIEGRTRRDDDDQILEAKLVRALPDEGCVHAESGPARVSIGMSLIAAASFRYSGLFMHGGRWLWVHAWTDDYAELSVALSFPAPRDLRQVAYDVGTQLGRAHPRQRPGKPGPRTLRLCLLESVSENEARIRAAVAELTEATVDAWAAFRGGTR
jgi:hypothetical protein